MDTGQLVLIIVLAIVVIAAVIVAVVIGRRKKAEINHHRAEDLREKAAEEAIGAHQAKAESAQAEADALRAEVEANRLRQEAERHAETANEAHGRVEENLRHADKLDPQVNTRSSDRDRAEDGDHTGNSHAAEGERLTRDRSGRNGSTPDGERKL